jgi:hypothetical protein
MRKCLLTLLALAALGLRAAPAQAGIWTEVGDAGQLPATAQVTVGDGPLDTIFGRIAGPNDVDMYLIRITDPALFSATTVSTPGSALTDTRLFLFDAGGLGVYANDDISATNLFSQLPAGLPVGPQEPGLYYLAVSAFDVFPVSNDVIFPDFPSTGVFGPTGPGGASPVSDWGGQGLQVGDYTIQLTGAAYAFTPVPGGLVLAGSGALVLFAYGARRRAGPRGPTKRG